MRVILAFLLALLPGFALAVQPDEILKDPALESRARNISSELRCLVCQNQSIDDSDAGLARDLRVMVRERLQAGDSDAQVQEFLVQRYGEFILLKPPFKAGTLLLWLAPLFILLGSGAALFVFVRRRKPAESAAALSAEEQAKLSELLDGRAGQPR